MWLDEGRGELVQIYILPVINKLHSRIWALGTEGFSVYIEDIFKINKYSHKRWK